MNGVRDREDSRFDLEKLLDRIGDLLDEVEQQLDAAENGNNEGRE